MRAFRGFCIGLVIGSVIALTWTDARLRHYDQVARNAEAASTIKQAAYAESLTFIRRDTVRVTKWATRYDTIRQELATVLASDTVQTVPSEWVRQLITVSDSTVQACRDLVGSTRGALTACDSAQSALRLESAAWKKAFQAAKPSRFQRALPWLAGAAGLYVGAKLRVR